MGETKGGEGDVHPFQMKREREREREREGGGPEPVNTSYFVLVNEIH